MLNMLLQAARYARERTTTAITNTKTTTTTTRSGTLSCRSLLPRASRNAAAPPPRQAGRVGHKLNPCVTRAAAMHGPPSCPLPAAPPSHPHPSPQLQASLQPCHASTGLLQLQLHLRLNPRPPLPLVHHSLNVALGGSARRSACLRACDQLQCLIAMRRRRGRPATSTSSSSS